MLNSKMIAAAAAAIAFTAIGIQGANAAPRHGGFYGHQGKVAIVNHRIRKQARRIRRAHRRGRLDWVQAYRARFELSHIRTFRSSYLQDGRLSRRENRHIHRLLDRNHRRIRRMARHNWGGWRRSRQGRVEQFRNDRFNDARPIRSRYDGFRR